MDEIGVDVFILAVRMEQGLFPQFQEQMNNRY